MLSILCTACEDVIHVDLEKGETLLVVDAFLNDNGATQKLRLTTTAEYFSNASTPPVLGATVTLTDLTANKNFSFTGDGLGNYVYVPQVNDSMAQVGHTYQLSISYNGGSYIALSTLNRTTSIDTIIFKRQKSGLEDTTAEPKKYFPYLIARDAPGALDFYWIRTYRNGVFYNGSNQLNVVQDAGGTGTDGLYIIPPNAFFLLTPDNEPVYYLDACTIEMYSINKDTYDFLLQMQIQMNNAQAGLFATAPENVRTNIKQVSATGLRAIGWFNMGSTRSKTVIAS